MGFMEILLEAKRKEKPKKAENDKLDVDVEDAKEDEEPETDKENNSDDSTPDTEDTENDEDEVTDYSEEEFDIEADTDEDDTSTEDSDDLGTEGDRDAGASDDGGSDQDSDIDDETTDYTDDSTSDTESDDNLQDDSENSEDTSSENEQEDNEEEAGRELKLLTDFSNLYQMIVDSLNKLNNTTTVNLITKQIITQVSKNLSNTKDMLYDYIVLDYKKNTYGQRLQQYAYFLEAVKINVSMLKKVSTSFSLGKTK